MMTKKGVDLLLLRYNDRLFAVVAVQTVNFSTTAPPLVFGRPAGVLRVAMQLVLPKMLYSP